MSSQPASRVNLNLTLADIVPAARAAEIPQRRRQEIIAAVRTVGRVLQKPLDRILADPRHLSVKLQDVAPRAIG
jgi:hypothetical protein